MNSEEDKKWLYKKFSNQGYDIGSYEDFSKTLSNEDDKKWYYDKSKELNLNIGTYEDFDKLFGGIHQSEGLAPVIPWQQPQSYVEESPAFGVPPTQHLTDAAIAPVKEMLNNNVAEPVRDEKGRPYYPLKPKAVMEDEIRKEYQVEPVESQIDKAIAANEEEIAKVKKGANVREIEKIKENPISSLGFIFGSSDNTDNSERERLLKLEAERRKLQEAKKLIDASRTGSSVGDIPNNIGKGIKDAVLDDGYFDFGMSAMSDNSQLLSIKNKLDNKKPLTEDEQRLLNAAALAQEVTSTHQDRISPWYTAGQTTANMIPFMAEMAINPAAGLGKAAQKAVVRKISNVVGKGLAKKMLPKLARTTGDVVGASIMTGTTGAMRTIADTENRMLGEVDSSVKDGKIIGDGFSGGLDKLEASGKAFASNTIENWSEMLGEYFAPVLKGAGYIAGKGMRKMGMGKVMDFISDINSTPFAKGLDDILEQTQWSGPIGEIAEEEAGIIANSYITGDNKLSDLIDPKQQLDIVLGVGLFGGFVSGIKTIGYRTPEKRAERDFNKSEKNASSMFDNWEDLRSEIDDADETELPEVINTIAKSDVVGNDRKKKAAIIDYAYSLQKWRGENAAKMKQGVENPEITQELTDEKGDIVDLEEETASSSMDKVNVYRNFKRAERKVSQVLPGISTETMNSITDIDQFSAANNLNDVQKAAVSDYISAREPYNNYQADANVRKETFKSNAREQASADIDKIINKDNGFVIQAKDKSMDKPVYIERGNLVFDEDGLLDKEKTSERVYYRDENGDLQPKNPNEFDSIISQNTKDELIAEAEKQAENDFMLQEEQSLSSPDIPAPERGDRVVINGDTYLIEEQDVDVPGGVLAVKLDANGAIDVNNGRQISLSADEYYSAKEAELWGEQPKEEQSIESSEESTSITGEPIIMPESKIENESTTLNEESNVPQSEEVLEENTPSIPSDEKGNVLYHRVPAEVTIDAINREELEPDEIDSFVGANKESSAKLVSSLESKPPKMGTSIAKYKADKLAWSDKLSDAKAQVDYWNSVSEEIAASRVQPGDRTAEEIRSMGEPLTGEELAAAMLGTGRLPVLYDSYKKETGGRNAEARGMVGLFVSKANGGMTIEEAGEQLMLADQENGTNFFDPNDPNAGRNAIIDVLSGARTRGDLSGYIQRNREQMAERERQAEYDAYSSWTEDNFGMTPENYEAYEEQAPVSIAERFKDFDEEDFYNNIANELNEEQREVAGVTESSEVLQGEGIVSPERIETSNNEGGTVPVGSESNSENGALLEETPTELNETPIPAYNKEGVEEAIPESEMSTEEEMVQVENGDEVIEAAQETLNNIAEEREKVNQSPTEAQKEAGNYQKGHVKIGRYNISIENSKGSERSGVDSNGQAWSITMNNDYGYIRGTESVDGDHIDIFLSDLPDQGSVFVVDQVKEDGSFDEHKVMYGFSSVDEARDAYLANYSPGWKGLGTITEVSKEDFNKWIDSSKRKTKAFAEYKAIRENANSKDTAVDNNIRFREASDVGEPALKWNSTNEELNNEKPDGYEGNEKLTVNNVNQKIYDISGPHLGKLYKNGSLGRVLVGDHADINQIKASREYNSVRENLVPLRRKLEEMIPHCTDAARKEVENTISDIDYALDYYKRLYEGEDVWRSAARPRFRILDEQSNTSTEEGGDVVAKVGELAGSLHTPVRVARTISDVPDGVAKRAIEKGRNIKGWYDTKTGEVVVYLPNTVSIADAQATILHEVVAHKGLRDMLGKETFDELCGKVFDVLPDDIRNGLLEKHGDRLIAGDEYMASIAESDIEPSLWRKIKSFVRDAFRKMGVDLSVSDNDIRYLLWKSKNRLMSRDNGMDLVNRMAADENMKERFHVGEYTRTPEQEKADYDRASKTVSDFAQDHAGAANALVIRSRDMMRKQLEAIGMPDESIDEIENAFNSGEAVAVYNEEVGRVIISNDGASETELKGYLWHENTHKAIREIYGDEAEAAINPVYEWLNNRKSDDCHFIRNLYSESTDAVQKEECVVAYFEKMFSVHGEDRLKEIINDASSLELSDFFNKTFNNIVYGTEEEGNKGNRSLGRGFQTELEVRNSGNAGFREKNEGAGREASRAETETEEPRGKGVRFREEESDDVSDGTREAYEKAINTKGSVGKAHLSAYNFQEAFQDETLSVKILQKIIEEHSGEKLKGYENAYQAENRLGSMNLQQRNKFIEELYEPMMKIVDGIMKKGVSEKEIKYYLIAKSGLERNREFAVRDAIAAEEKDNGKESAQKLRKQYVENRNNLRQQHADGKLNWDEYQDRLDELAALYASKFSDYSGLTAITGDEMHFTDLAKDIVKNFEANHETKALWDSIDATTKYSLKKSYESGIMGKEAYNHVNDMFEYYIPMRGWNEETAEDVYDYIRQERGTFSATIEKASGHKHESYEPFAIIGNMAESTILQGNRNLMKQKFMNMVMNHPSDVATLSQVWFKKNTKGEWEASFPNIANDATADKVAQTIEEHEKEMLELEKDGKAECRSNKLDINYHIDPKNISQHAVVVKRGGKDYVIYINGNPRAAEALNGKLKSGKQNIAWDFYDYLKRQYAAGMTSYNVNFVGANVARDVQHAFFITYLDKGVKSSAKLAKNGPKALKIVARGVSGKLDLNRKEDNYYKEFLENGGETGYSNLNSIEAWKADNDKRMSRLKGLSKSTGYVKEGLKHLADWFEFANRIAENSTRFNAYMLAREDGKGVGEAINEAKNITVNFNKKGSGQTPGLYGAAANIFRRWVLFANPIIQGLYQVAHIGKQHKARLASAWALHTSMGFAVPMLNAMLVGMYGDDDDDYFNQNDYTRRNNLMLYIPKIGYLKIPLAPVFRNMYAMGDILYMKTHNLSTAEDVFFDSINEARSMLSLEGQSGRKEWDPGRFIAPDLMGPILDIKENENFAGSPIYKSTEFNKLDPEFKKIYKDAWTPLVELSKTLNSVGGNDYRKSEYFGKWINPAAMQHLITNYTGGVGQLIGDFSSVLSDAFSGKIVENFDVMKVPVVKRFFTIPNERTSGTAIRRKYFKIKDEMDALNHEVRERAKSVGSDLRLTNKLSELQNSDEYNNLLVFKGFAKQIAAEETPEKKVELMKTFIEWYDKEKKKQK